MTLGKMTLLFFSEALAACQENNKLSVRYFHRKPAVINNYFYRHIIFVQIYL